jgi:hypothetical protein
MTDVTIDSQLLYLRSNSLYSNKKIEHLNKKKKTRASEFYTLTTPCDAHKKICTCSTGIPQFLEEETISRRIDHSFDNNRLGEVE